VVEAAQRPEGQATPAQEAAQAQLTQQAAQDTPAPHPDQDLLARIKRLHAEAAERAKASAELAKALDRAARGLEVLLRQQPWGPQSLVAVAKAFSAPEALAPADLDGLWRALMADVQAHIDAQAAAARQHLLARLRDAAAAESISFERLSESPPVLALQPFSLEIDWDNHRAALLFGRDAVDEDIPLEAGEIMRRRALAVKAIQAAALPSERFFDLLKLAWQVTLTARGQPDDARVDVVDLLGPLSLLTSSPDAWRSLRERDIKPYPRAMLVYQLYRLRRDRALERDGWRLDLGAATGGSTRKKQNVLFIPTTPGDGQYYLTARFLRVGSAQPPPSGGAEEPPAP
jgi:hypothetical protein